MRHIELVFHNIIKRHHQTIECSKNFSDFLTMIEVKLCCSCLSLRTGIWIIGGFTILTGAVLPMSKLFVDDYDWSTPLHVMIFLVISIMLIIGEKKRRPDFVFPSLCLYFTCTFYNVPTIMIEELQTAILDNVESSDILIIILMHMFIAATIVYAYVVVNSLYEQLLREQYAVPKIENHDDVEQWNVHQYQYL